MAAAAVLERIESLPAPLAAAIDGRCGAGKTTLAELLRERTDCTVIHADSFFFAPSSAQRSDCPSPVGILTASGLSRKF